MEEIKDQYMVLLKSLCDGLTIKVNERMIRVLDIIISKKMHQGHKPRVVVASIIHVCANINFSRLSRVCRVSREALRQFTREIRTVLRDRKK